jgi:ATP-dependent protease ClpP protease subunit
MPKMTTTIFAAKKINNSAELTIYAPIEDEESWWYDSVTPKGVMRAVANLGNVSEIVVRINSNGGSAFAGMAIYQYLKDHAAKITVKVDGLAASAASIIAMAGDKIIMGTGAMLMIHNPWTVTMGEASELRKTADTLDKISQSLVAVYQERTGKAPEELQTMLDDSTWLTGDEAVSMGFADEVDRQFQVSAAIRGGIAVFNGQRFDLRAFASVPKLPEAAEDLNIRDEANSLPLFDVGERCVIVGTPHDPSHTGGEVREAVLTWTYGLLLDGMEDMGVHHWYVESELGPDESSSEDDEPDMSSMNKTKTPGGAETVKDLGELKTKHPDIYQAAIQAERDRIKALDDLASPANAAIITAAKESGATPEATAMEIIKADNARRAAMAGKLKSDADKSGIDDLEPDAPDDLIPSSKEVKDQKKTEAQASGIAAKAQKLRGGTR